MALATTFFATPKTSGKKGTLMPTVTKQDLIAMIVERTGCSKVLAAKVVDSLFRAMRESLIDGNRIEIRNLGSWTVKRTNPRPNARNPRTGEHVSVPAHWKVMSKPGKILKAGMKGPVGE